MVYEVIFTTVASLGVISRKGHKKEVKEWRKKACLAGRTYTEASFPNNIKQTPGIHVNISFTLIKPPKNNTICGRLRKNS